MTDEERLERWAKWITLIQGDIWELFYLHFTFSEVQEIIKDNEGLSEPRERLLLIAAPGQLNCSALAREVE